MTGDGGRVFGTQVYSGCRSGAWPTSEREGSHQESEEPLAWMRGLPWGRAGGRCQGGCRGALSQKRVAPGQASTEHLFCTGGAMTVVGSQFSGYSQDSALWGSGQTQGNSRAPAKPWSSLAPPCGPGDQEAA